MSMLGPLMECCSNRRNDDEGEQLLRDRGQLSDRTRRGIVVDMYQGGAHNYQRKDSKNRHEVHVGSDSPRFSSSQDSPRMHDLQMHSPRDNVGVGIIFDAGTEGRGPDGSGLCVNGLSPDGPADQCKSIHIGDVLVEIDGVDVQGKTAGGRFDHPYYVTLERKRTVNRRLKLPH